MASTSGGAEQIIQAEIEATRVQLASTLDELVDRVSPQRVATRGLARVQEVLVETFTRPVLVGDVFATSGDAGADVEIAYRGPWEIRWERVAPAAAGAVVLVAVVVWRKRRS